MLQEDFSERMMRQKIFLVILVGSLWTPIFLCTASASFADPDLAARTESLPASWIKQKSIESQYYHFADSDKSVVNSWQQWIQLPVVKRWKWINGFARSKFSEQNVAATYENKYTLGALYEAERYGLEVRYGYRDFSHLNGAHTYALKAFGPVFFLKNVMLAHEYDCWETSKAIRAKTRAYNNFINIYQPLGWHWVWTSFFQQHRFNDRNIRNYLREALMYRLLKGRPELQLGYEYLYNHMRFSAPAYWSPDHLQIHQIKMLLAGNLWRARLNYEFIYALGFARQKAEEDRLVSSGTANVVCAVSQAWELFVNYEISVEPTYNNRAVRAGLRYKF